MENRVKNLVINKVKNKMEVFILTYQNFDITNEAKYNINKNLTIERIFDFDLSELGNLTAREIVLIDAPGGSGTDNGDPSGGGSAYCYSVSIIINYPCSGLNSTGTHYHDSSCNCKDTPGGCSSPFSQYLSDTFCTSDSNSTAAASTYLANNNQSSGGNSNVTITNNNIIISSIIENQVPEGADPLAFKLNLASDSDAYNWLVNTATIDEYNALGFFLEENTFSDEAKAFAVQMIDKMRLNPTVFTSIVPFLIEKNIDDTNLDPCSKGVFQQIKNTTVCDFAYLFAKLGADDSVYNTTIKTEHNSVMVNGQLEEVGDPANTIRTTPGTKYNYTVYVNPDYPGKTKLFIAAFLLHEMAHAYFFSLVDDYNMGATNSFNELPILFNAAVVNHFPIGPNLHHEEIANSYVSAIAAALQEFQPGLPQQVYDDLAWSGLEKTSIFNTLYPQGSTSRERILNRKTAEQTGNSIAQGTPNQQNPMGQPCN